MMTQSDQDKQDLEYIYQRFTDFLHENPSGEEALLQWLRDKREREKPSAPVEG